MRALTLVLILALPACGRGPVQPDDVLPQTRQVTSANFVFHYTMGDASIVEALGDRVDAASQRIAGDLGAANMPRVNVHVYATHAEMAAAVRPVVPSLPSWATGLFTAPDRIHLLSPVRLGQTADRAAVSVLHEFGHCVTLHLNPASANNPRWLWETVALFEARQQVDPRTLPYLVAGEWPSLSALDAMSNPQIYEVGYLLGEFVVDRAGLAGLRALIASRGNTLTALGLDEPAFESQWGEFVRNRYFR